MRHVSAVCLACVLTLLAAPASAQDVGLAAGARLGTPTALSLKAFVTDEIAFEGMLGVRPHFGSDFTSANVRLAGFYHYDLELDDDWEPLQLMMGAGLGLTFWNYDDDFFVRRNERDFDNTSLNFRLYVGGQYAFEDVPLEITADVGPGLRFGSIFYGFFGLHTSVGVRYIISRR